MIQPNEDGSYWRKIVRNKMVRMKEKRREQVCRSMRIKHISSLDVALSFHLTHLVRSVRV